ncbi:MAG: hypothetical protein OEW18_09635, partial [Candidatus Aminicenantes bacterium]|nr:hypothetical protein [Candidatus Aminicenantes bacterium]
LYPCLIFPIGALIAMAYRNSIVKRKRLRAGFIALTILMFVFFSGRQALVLYRLHFSKNDVEVRYKAEAENFSQHLDRLSDDFSRLLESHSIAWKWELMDVERYDVNGFFTVLKHLRMEPGYVLDYVYFHDRQSGFPVLYAHRSDEAAFKNYEEYRQARGEIGEDEYWDRVYGRSRTENDKKIFGYLDRVLIDDQPEGYFQYVLLRIMGSQFYLFWHADYNDQRPLFGYSQLREVMSKERDMIKRWNVWEYGPWAWLGFDPWILIHKAAELDFKPSISMGKKEVEIKIVIFTNWGGLIKRTFVVNRAFPHLLLREDQQTLIPYFCGRVF